MAPKKKLRRAFWVLGIFDTLFARAKAPPVQHGGWVAVAQMRSVMNALASLSAPRCALQSGVHSQCKCGHNADTAFISALGSELSV